MGERRTSLLATAALLGMTAAWGSSFYLTKDLLEHVPAIDFLAVRFALAGLVLLAVAPRAVGRLSLEVRRRAFVLGLVYGAAQLMQTVGLAHTAASVSGFVTGLYVVLTPLLAAVVLGTRITGATWGAVLLATTGLGVLTLDGLSIGYGEAVTLVGAVLYAVHIVGLAAWSSAADALGMTIVQVLVIAGTCLAGALLTGRIGEVVLPQHAGDWVSLVYMALIPGAAAMLAQTWAQAHLPATRSAIIMSSEPVFATVFAVLLGGESTTSRMLLGGALVLVAMVVTELTPRRRVEAEVTHLTV
ncbi:DMT family transporter [Nocardioides sp. GY 10113]|uniref:DMT family transporter n=1 Tax=Nocardioides sp. GY 10113 TaxID=2569761 RepID=UPI0010A825BF|nr:DMT family transporter [Nocardioides sp. GY 10113]TIC88666.1 DMT family transporter [Nocardioides sp. GY 10113]